MSRQAGNAAACLRHKHCLPLPACLSACSTSIAGPCLPAFLQHSPQSSYLLQYIVIQFSGLPACPAAPSLCTCVCMT